MRTKTGILVSSALLLGFASAAPAHAKFLSVDPVTYLEDGRPGMINRYSYAFNDPINMIDPDGRQVRELEEGKAFSFTAKIENQSSQDLTNDQLQTIGNEIGATIDGSFSGSKGWFRGDVTMTSDISVGDAVGDVTQISIVDDVVGPDGNTIPNAGGIFEGDFGGGGDIQITTAAVENSGAPRTGGHEFGHSFGNLRHPAGTSFTLMDPSFKSKSTHIRADQRRQAVKNFQQIAKD